MELRPTLIEDFKTLVAEQGMSEDTIIIKKNKGILRTHNQCKTRLLLGPDVIVLGSPSLFV